MEINDLDEILILNRVIMTIRFHQSDYDNKDVVGSPFIGSVHKKILDELRSKLSNIDYLKSEEDMTIEKYPSYIEVIKKHTINIDNWKGLSTNIRIEVIKDMVYPFTIKPETMSKLIQ